MLRNAKYNTIAPAYARAVMLLALIICGGTQVLRAQGYFTLTNGHYYWFDGTENDPDDTKYLTAFDKANSWNEIFASETVRECINKTRKKYLISLDNGVTFKEFGK